MISKERIKTNLLLMDDLNYWEELTIKNNFDDYEGEYQEGLIKLINRQIQNGIKWLESQEAKDFFYNELEYQQEVFQTLESEWERILSGMYETVDDIINECYEYGKVKGYKDIRSRIKYSDSDRLALAHARKYNYQLIQKIDGELRRSIKNTIFQGVIKGENPVKLAPKIEELGIKRLPNSTLSPYQRAVMIARTEVARAQNTGILQSYVNEGYEEVKILTAEDSNVCYLCLQNAYEFNEDDKVIFENRGKERIHNIQTLIKDKNYVPLHPNCRCTYIVVWKRNRTPPEHPYTVDLTHDKSHNWTYDYGGKHYQMQGNNLMGRQQFLEEYGLDIDKLDDDEKLFLQIFTKNSGPLNKYLRSKNPEQDLEECSNKWEETIDKLRIGNIISKRLSFGDALTIYERIFTKYSKSLNEDIILCRREKKRHMVPDANGEYNLKGFTSTSIYEFAKEDDYGNELSYILIPKGTNVLYLEGMTSSPKDFEVAFKPGMQLKHIEDLSSRKKVWILS